MADFVHLHLHTEYSLLDGACRIDRLFDRVKEHGQTAVAVTDHGAMYGAVDFYKAGKAAGVKPIIGCEMYLAERSLSDKVYTLDRECYHLVLLVKNGAGYKNLIKLNSIAHLEGFYNRPRIDMKTLSLHSEGLIALSACRYGRIGRYIEEGDYPSAKKHALEMREIFGEDYYLELQDHGIPEEAVTASQIKRLSRETGIPLVATNDVHYIDRTDAKSHSVLMCIQTASTVEEGSVEGFSTDRFHLASTEEMYELFSDVPEALENTVRIAEKCNFDFNFGKYFLPSFKNDRGMDNEDYLKMLVREGLEALIAREGIDYPRAEEYRSRADHELKVIAEMGFCEYFLIVRDFVSFAKSHAIPVGPGRGSGAGSLCAYCLGITGIDPIKHDLLFERFLNPERVSMPDFDIDFCQDRRHEVIEYVEQKYGASHVSKIVTFNTMAARAVVRDVGRALGMTYPQVDAVARLIPRAIDMTIDRAMSEVPELLDTYKRYPDVKELIDIARTLEGMPRHVSIHAAAVVITDREVSEYVPLCTSSDFTVTQYSMNSIADLGLLKIDFLGLRYLTVIDTAERMVRETVPDFDVEKIDLHDQKVFDYISAGNTMGMFQIESRGMRSLVTRLRPRSVEDITAAIALFRPGPMDAIPRYIANSKKRDSLTYAIPQLKSILSVTYGCIVYQEQVMQIFRSLAGYSYGHADIVRRAMAKKKADVMENERETFVRGCVNNGISEADAVAVFDEMADFAKYAFNKSHACAYSYLTYRTAYLKYYYPAQYMAALITSTLGDDEKVNFYITECKEMGIRILPPDVNAPTAAFTVTGKAIRFGMLAVKNVGAGFVNALCEERKRGEFKTYEEFLTRMSARTLNRKTVDSLIYAGALDCFKKDRSKMAAVLEDAINTVNDINRRNVTGQMDFFSDSGSDETVLKINYPNNRDDTLVERLAKEKEMAGAYLTGHPLDAYSKQIKSCVLIADIREAFETSSHEFREGQVVDVLGMLGEKKVKETKSGALMAFVPITDAYTSAELVIFPKTFDSVERLLEEDRVVVAKCEISLKDDDVKLLVRSMTEAVEDHLYTEEVKPKAPETADTSERYKGKKLYLRLKERDEALIKRIGALVYIFEGETPVVLYLESEKKYIKLVGGGVGLTDEVLGDLYKLVGKDNTVVK